MPAYARSSMHVSPPRGRLTRDPPRCGGRCLALRSVAHSSAASESKVAILNSTPNHLAPNEPANHLEIEAPEPLDPAHVPPSSVFVQARRVSKNLQLSFPTPAITYKRSARPAGEHAATLRSETNSMVSSPMSPIQDLVLAALSNGASLSDAASQAKSIATRSRIGVAPPRFPDRARRRAVRSRMLVREQAQALAPNCLETVREILTDPKPHPLRAPQSRARNPATKPPLRRPTHPELHEFSQP